MSCISPDVKPDWKAYLLGELNPEVSRQAETHLAACSNCHEEVATLRLTLDTLSTLREEEVPRRIAFVSDKVFEPRWWQRAFNQTVFTPTFAAGALVAAAILVHGAVRPGQAQVEAAVTEAVSQVEARHTQEMQVILEQLDVRNKQVANMYRNAVLNQ
jgi:anti-sigma factor RsiW